MTAYYNESIPALAQWMRNQLAAGRIAPGDVDEKSIADVSPDDIVGYTQCHFFAGIGEWSQAMRLAGWPDEKPVWTGSCPCQPFSIAGKGKAFDDSRHLWPEWFRLIRECRPAILFGEQVEAAINWGWLDLVQADLESEGYACGAAVLPAAGIGAPHIRHRLWFVGKHAENELAYTGCGRQPVERLSREERKPGMETPGHSETGGLGNALLPGLEGHPRNEGQDRKQEPHRPVAETGHAPCGVAEGQPAGRPVDGFWRDADWLFCRDGKWRPIKSGIKPLAHRPASRVGRLRAYGNAIVPQVAAEFIRACM